MDLGRASRSTPVGLFAQEALVVGAVDVAQRGLVEVSRASLPDDAAFAQRDDALAQRRAAAATTPSLFLGLVLGWIDADFRVQIRILQHFSKSTRKSSSREQIL